MRVGLAVTHRNYESGTVSVSVDDATVIAKALGVAPAELLLAMTTKALTSRDKYPVISKVQAGAWCEAVEPYTLKDIDLWLESDAHIQGRRSGCRLMVTQ